MAEHDLGNRITANAEGADDAKVLIDSALRFVKEKHGFAPVDETPLFQGVYYDSKKVGSFITRVSGPSGDTAVLKLQLKSLPFDEGGIIRSVEKARRTDNVRPVRILHDSAWSADIGFGYLLFEDISHLPNLWRNAPTTEDDRKRHKAFLEAFTGGILPIPDPWVPKPGGIYREKLLETFEHFRAITRKSVHRHVSEDELRPFVERFLAIASARDITTKMHFTHGHLSGFDVKHDTANDQYILMANLYWSWRPTYYEMVFPMWVDLMQIRDADLTFGQFLDRVHAWADTWGTEVTSEEGFWLRLLERSVLTIMVDLGASEWGAHEMAEKQALLTRWKEFFDWLVQNKFQDVRGERP